MSETFTADNRTERASADALHTLLRPRESQDASGTASGRQPVEPAVRRPVKAVRHRVSGTIRRRNQ